MDVQKADPRTRRNAIVLVLGALAVGGWLVLALQSRRSELQAWLLANADLFARHPELVAAGAFAFLLPLVGAGVYLWRLGDRIVRAERLPPPGLAVTRDTRVISGPAAVARGRSIKVLAVVVAGSAVAIPIVLLRIARTLAPG